MTGFNVRCSDTTIRVYFNKTALDERNNPDGSNQRNFTIGWENQKGDPSCNVNYMNTSNIDETGSVKVSGITPFDKIVMISADFSPSTCGIVEMQNMDYIYYNSTIVVTYGEDPAGGLIRREEYDYYNVSCFRNRTIEEKLSGDSFDTQFRTEGRDNKSELIHIPDRN